MADIHVTKELLDGTIGNLEEALKFLREASADIEQVSPQGFKLGKAPNITDGIPAVIRFAMDVHSRLKVAKAENLLGKTAYSKRKQRLAE